MNWDIYNSLEDFTEKHCPYSNHFCNGQAIHGRDELMRFRRIKDKPVCQYYDIEKGCRHRYNPKNREAKE